MSRALTNSEREHIMWRIADATGAKERLFQQRFFGASYTEQYIADWATTRDTYIMLLAAERPAVHPEPRIITGKATT